MYNFTDHHFTEEEEYSMVSEVCEKYDYSFEGLASFVLEYGSGRKEPEFTPEQQIQVLDFMCNEFNIDMSYIPKYNEIEGTVVKFCVPEPPGNDVMISDPFIANLHSIFSCHPVLSNIEYILNHFNLVFAGSKTQEFCKQTLIENQKNYYVDVGRKYR